jgi:uncharacterized short protein YbdD (DUF466 family)
MRRLSGDDAYERYLQHFAQVHAADPLTMSTPLSRREFHRRRVEDKWSGISRCC